MSSGILLCSWEPSTFYNRSIHWLSPATQDSLHLCQELLKMPLLGWPFPLALLAVTCMAWFASLQKGLCTKTISLIVIWNASINILFLWVEHFLLPSPLAMIAENSPPDSHVALFFTSWSLLKWYLPWWPYLKFNSKTTLPLSCFIFCHSTFHRLTYAYFTFMFT